MTTLQEAAMRKALELFDAQWQCSRLFSLEEVQDVADELRTALAQQGEQPVAWMVESDGRHFIFRTDRPTVHAGEKLTPLYTAAPAPQPAQDAPVEVDWQDLYWKEKRRNEMWIAKYEKYIKPLEMAVPVTLQSAQPVAQPEGGKQGGKQQLPPLQPVAPLTQDQIKSMWAQYCGYPGGIFDFARAIEAAHGIKDGK